MTNPSRWYDDARAAAAVVALEGGATVVAAAVFVVRALVGHPADRGVAVALGALLAVYGAGILLVARGLLRHRSWARTPALLVQFFALVVAWYQRATEPALAVPLAVAAVAAVVLVLRSTRGERV